MVIGIGIDIVDLAEFRARLDEGLIDEIFLPAEIAYARTQLRSWENFAARLAAKEAAFKALGAGLTEGLGWHDVEVLRDETGPPRLAWHGRAREIVEARNVTAGHLTLSHSQDSALATVILTGPEA